MRLSIAKRYGLASVVLWSTAATAFKLALAGSGPCMVVLSASVVSLAFLAVLCASTGARLTWRIMMEALPRGVLNPFVYYLVLLEAYDRLPAQIAMVVNYLWPVVLVLLHAALGRRRLRSGSLLAVLISFGGVAVLALLGPGDGGRADAAGLALALASTVIWACYWILGLGRGGSEAPESVRLLAGFAWGVLFLAAYAAVTGSFAIPDARSAIAGVWIGLFEMGLTYVLWSRALSLAKEPAEVGSLVYLTPFLSLCFIALVLGEEIRPATLPGLVLVLAGIAVQRRVEARGRTRGGSEPQPSDVPGDRHEPRTP